METYITFPSATTAWDYIYSRGLDFDGYRPRKMYDSDQIGIAQLQNGYFVFLTENDASKMM